MTTTIVVTPGPTSVRLRVVSDAPGADRVEVLRTMRGSTSVVRAWPGYDGVAWVHVDVDILFNAPLTYTARMYAGDTLVEASDPSPEVVVARDGAVLRDALLPMQWAPLRLVGKEAGDTTTDVRRELLRPLGRSAPLAITDVRQKSTGTATVLTLNRAEQDQLRRMLDSGNILLFTGPQDYDISWPFYFSAGTVAVKRVSEAYDEARLWVFDWVEVDGPPITEPTRAVTWQQLLDTGTTWRDIRLTPWLDVMYPPGAPVRLAVG